jgi:hypothetical protein
MIEDDSKPKIDNVVQSAIADLIGKTCCRQRVGRMRSLSIGFGDKIPHGKSRLADDFYGEWEIGTYSAAWRVVHKETILCGSQDIVDSLSELDERLSKIVFGRIKEISSISKFDIRVYFDGETCLDFLGAASEEDELFHIFCPGNLYVEYSISGGWKIGKSNARNP